MAEAPATASDRGTGRRVLTVAQHLGSVGGTESAQLALCEGLAERGWEIHLVYVSAGDYWPWWQRLAASTTQVAASLPARGAPVRSALGVLKAGAAGVRIHPDVVYVHNAGDIPLALGVAALTRSRVVAHLHLPPPSRQPGWLNALMARCGALIAPSLDTATRWESAAGRPTGSVAVIPLGIDVGRFVPLEAAGRAQVRAGIGVAPDQPAVLYAGRIERIKGAHFLLEALGALPEFPQVVFCGEAKDHEYLDELQVTAAGRPVTFLGRRSDVAQLMACADLVAVPSNWLETQGLVISEAMACGTPVVASAVGGFTDTMRGFPDQLVPPADPPALAEVIGRLLNWRVEDPELGPRSRRWVEDNLSVEHSVAAVAEVLGAGSAPPR